MVRMKAALFTLTLTALLATPFASQAQQAQFAKPEDAVKYRQSVLSVMGTHFGRIGAVVKGEKPYDKNTVMADAALVEILSKLPWSAFPPGSDLMESKAKPDIWKQMPKFKDYSEKMQKEVANLSTAAKSGDLNKIKTAFGAAGKSCKACHDDFREK